MFINKIRVFPINNSKDHYTSIYKLHYKPYYIEVKGQSFYKRQIEFCKRMIKK